MEILPAQESDAREIIELVDAVWREHGFSLMIEIEERHLLDPGRYFRDQNGEFWVAREDGRMVGTVGFKIDNGIAEMKTLYVKADARGKGLGTRLSLMSIDAAKKNGAKLMELWSDTRFLEAHRLYERLGFKRFGERELNDHNDTREFGYRIDI